MTAKVKFAGQTDVTEFSAMLKSMAWAPTTFTSMANPFTRLLMGLLDESGRVTDMWCINDENPIASAPGYENKVILARFVANPIARNCKVFVSNMIRGSGINVPSLETYCQQLERDFMRKWWNI